MSGVPVPSQRTVTGRGATRSNGAGADQLDRGVERAASFVDPTASTVFSDALAIALQPRCDQSGARQIQSLAGAYLIARSARTCAKPLSPMPTRPRTIAILSATGCSA